MQLYVRKRFWRLRKWLGLSASSLIPPDQYSIDYEAGVIKFESPPSPGAVTFDFSPDEYRAIAFHRDRVLNQRHQPL